MNPILKAKLMIAGALAMVALVIGLGVTAAVYKNLYETTSLALNTVNDSIKAQNKEAARKLAELTAERDKKQAEINKAAKDQETKDAQAKSEIARLDAELRNRPVLVRIVASGQGGGSPPSGTATSAQDSAGGEAETYGLLPPENTRRLNEALTEVEMLSAAYTSCRQRIIPTEPQVDPLSPSHGRHPLSQPQ